MAITQDERTLDITTPLGKDYLLLQSFRAVEGISQLFSIEAECLHEESESGEAPTPLKPESLLAQGVHIRVQREDGSVRHFNGIVNRIAQGSRDEKFTSYSLSIVPQAWLLTQKRQSRIFQNMSTKDILEKVFTGLQITNKIQKATDPRVYCVQYRETDWDFASRLMEEEGIYYYFEHLEDRHRLVLADMPDGHSYVPNNKTFDFILKTDQQGGSVSAVDGWSVVNRLNTGKVTVWDHHFQSPAQRLEGAQTTAIQNGNNKTLEDYDYPGGYARWNDDSSSRFKLQIDADRIAEIRMQEIDGRFTVASGSSYVCSVTAGHRFELAGHPNDDYNRAWMITQAVHTAEQSPNYYSDDVNFSAYSNTFSCIPHGQGAIPYRPERRTPKPIVHGSHTAWVVGSEEITTDEYGRVKVQFHWDREGKGDANSSCWLRVAQGWAGRQFGMMFIPRVGMQVVVDFFEGDPDQPIITGFVHNADAKPAYTLPDHKTRSYIKTNSVGGSGFNEIRFEDKSGSEQIFIHAQKNKDIRVKKDLKETIEQDRHLLIKRDQFEKVDKDKHLKIKGDHNEDIGGKAGIKVGTNMEIKTGSKFAADAGSEVHIKAGATAVIEAGASLTLKVGGSFVAINPGGVFIKGPMVHLNSAGAAGSGSGSNPSPPKDPLEADTSEAGQSGGIKPSAPPPKAPAEYEKMAEAARQRASDPSPPPPPKTDVEEIKQVKEHLDSMNPNWSKNDLKTVVLPKLSGDARKEMQEILEMDHAVAKLDRLRTLTDTALNEAVQQAADARQQVADLQQQAAQQAADIRANYQEFKEDVEEQRENYQEFKEDAEEAAAKAEEAAVKYEEFKEEIGEQAVAMVDAAKDGVPYVAFPG